MSDNTVLKVLVKVIYLVIISFNIIFKLVVAPLAKGNMSSWSILQIRVFYLFMDISLS